jgi:hypothetical protein
MLLFVHAKPFNERIQQNIKAKHKIPILYCTANQLIKVKVSFQTERLPCFGYRRGAAGIFTQDA